MNAKSGKEEPTQTASTRKKALMQSDVPAFTLVEALKVAETIRDNYAKQPTAPFDVAKSLNMSPGSSAFKMVTGASMAYGLTDGAAQSAQISITDLGRRVVSPTEEGDDFTAMREAALKPRVIREFLEKYNTNTLPQKTIALNVLESMNIPSSATERAYDMIINNAEAMGLFVNIKGKKYVRLDNPELPAQAPPTDGPSPETESAPESAKDADETGSSSYAVDDAPALRGPTPTDPVFNNRVFITHGKNTEIVEQVKKILTFGNFEPMVSVQKQSLAKPVPDKVMDDMRACSAAVVHVNVENKLMDQDGKEHIQINSNVLIEIGAAMALYGRRFVLLVEKGATLPSNLQGLYEVRYEGEQLEFDATMKLLEAFSEFRK